MEIDDLYIIDFESFEAMIAGWTRWVDRKELIEGPRDRKCAFCYYDVHRHYVYASRTSAEAPETYVCGPCIKADRPGQAIASWHQMIEEKKALPPLVLGGS